MTVNGHIKIYYVNDSKKLSRVSRHCIFHRKKMRFDEAITRLNSMAIIPSTVYHMFNLHDAEGFFETQDNRQNALTNAKIFHFKRTISDNCVYFIITSPLSGNSLFFFSQKHYVYIHININIV